MCDREPNEVGEIDRKRHLGNGQKRFERHVFARAPWLRFALDPILRGARKIGFVIENRLENGAGIIEREANAQGEQAWQK